MQVQILDAELNAKIGNTMLESAGDTAGLHTLAANIKDKTGITVVARLDESNNTVVVKRLLIG
jgi:hypothetical protein